MTNAQLMTVLEDVRAKLMPLSTTFPVARKILADINCELVRLRALDVHARMLSNAAATQPATSADHA